jgi:NAD dependent epimerase/dehydratase family enzyme
MAQEMLLEGNKVIPDKLIANGFKFEYQNLEAALLKEIRPAALEKVGAAE